VTSIRPFDVLQMKRTKPLETPSFSHQTIGI